MNVGLIGLGYWGKNVLRNLITHKNINNIYILDTNIVKIKKLPNIFYFNNNKQFFSNKNIDFYIVVYLRCYG